MTQREFFRDFRSPQACHLDAAHDLNRSHPRRNRRARASAGVCLKTASSPQTGTTAAVHNVPHRHLKKNTTRPWAKHVLEIKMDSFWLEYPAYGAEAPAHRHGVIAFIIIYINLQACAAKKKKEKKKGVNGAGGTNLPFSKTGLFCSFYFTAFCILTRRHGCSNGAPPKKQNQHMNKLDTTSRTSDSQLCVTVYSLALSKRTITDLIQLLLLCNTVVVRVPLCVMAFGSFWPCNQDL